MPTVPARNFGRNKKYPGDTFTLLGTPQPTNNHHTAIRTEVTKVQLKWTSTTGMQNCQQPTTAAAPTQQPPCKYTFWWSSPPKTVVGKKSAKAQKETPPPEPYKNVMHERRIVRGSNFAANQLLGDYDPFDKAAEYRRRQVLRKKNVNHRNQRNVLGTPPPVEGRRHEDVQTDKYLEELVAKPMETSIETQTDLFLEKPPTPPYIPAKIGVDVATEIGDGELFQFDAEAQPIIDVMIDSIMELSILEVAHEQEISEIRKKQQELLAERETELAELRRLEEEEVRLQAEKQRRLRQDTIAKSLDEEIQRGVTAAKLLQGHIASILPEVLDSLEPATDAAKKEQLMKTVCPWLSAEVAEEVGQIVDSREILTVIIQEIIKQRAETYVGYKEETPAKLEDITEEEQAPEESCETEAEAHEPRCPPDVS